MRVAILGNAGSGKSTLAVKLSKALELPLYEVDKFLWLDGWVLAPEADYNNTHQKILTSDKWVLEGLGRKESIPERIECATHIILCDIPIWQNYWLLAERQSIWNKGQIELPPGGQPAAPSTRKLFETVWTVEQDWMPEIRALVRCAWSTKTVQVVSSFEELQSFNFNQG